MQLFDEDKANNFILLLLCLEKLGGSFSFTPEDYEWTKTHKLKSDCDGFLEDGGCVEIENIPQPISKPKEIEWHVEDLFNNFPRYDGGRKRPHFYR